MSPTSPTTPLHPTNPPTISVVVCTKGRPVSLSRCVRSVLQQGLLPIEVIVVDDGCLAPVVTDDLKARCERASVDWRYLTKTVPGLPRSRNLAVRHAAGDIIQFFDDDITIQPGFLLSIQSLYAADTGHVVAGADAHLLDPSPPTRGEKLYRLGYRTAGWWAIHPRHTRRPPQHGPIASFPGVRPVWNVVGATLSARRSVLIEIPFDEALGGYALGEDRDWSYRAGRNYWILRNHNARAVHRHEPTARPDPRQFGWMTVRNYLHIIRKSCEPGIGRSIVIGWTFTILVALQVLYCIVGNTRQHSLELAGMLQAFWGFLSWRKNRASYS